MISGKVKIVEYEENQSAVHAASLGQMKVVKVAIELPYTFCSIYCEDLYEIPKLVF